jgi:hypothetical protein
MHRTGCVGPVAERVGVKSAEESMILPRQRRPALAVLGRIASSPRLWTYLGCTVLALSMSVFLGKDMNWDTLEYHFYAGFSALHDRFGRDYFAAGSESYFNPYIYVPFYLLASSRLPAIVVASILALVQSGILWLTYEIALQLFPAADGRTRLIVGIGAALFAAANPILLNLFGSSYADVLTAELVLGGWLLLVRSVHAPSLRYALAAGVILGAASALKLTNSVHALCAAVILLFVPVRWPDRIRHLIVFGAALASSFVLVCLPWSLRLERHFGNPLFPLLNGIFRSPQYPVATMLDYRFIPDSLREALWRPFAIAVPRFMVDDELQSPDIRYAVLLLAAILLAFRWGWRRWRGRPAEPVPAGATAAQAERALAALGAGFAADWILWVTASGNGRYFLPMACVAGILAIALIWRLAGSPKIRLYALAGILGVQGLQLGLGTVYRDHVPWNGAPWFEVRLPAALPRTPALYLSYGVQSNAFIVPFLPRGSGFVNIAGDYPLPPHGANGAAVAALIRRYAPHLRVLARDTRARNKHLPVISGIAAAEDALRPFGLAPVMNRCATIEVPDEGRQNLVFVHTQLQGKQTAAKPVPDREVRESSTGYLTTCPVVPHAFRNAGLARGESDASRVLDRLEDACPELFQPARALTQFYGDPTHQIWARRYLNTNLTAWVSRGWVQFVDPLRGGPASFIGPVSAFEGKRLRIDCGRRGERYFAKVAPATPPGAGK